MKFKHSLIDFSSGPVLCVIHQRSKASPKRCLLAIADSIALHRLPPVHQSLHPIDLSSPLSASSRSSSDTSHSMPQHNYGTTSPPASSSTTLPPTPSRSRHDEGHASIFSSVTNLANTVIGAGALAFPSAFAAMGLIPGAISCLFSGSLTIFGLYLLSRCATLVGKRPGDEGRKASFNEVARLTFGKGWATNLFDVSLQLARGYLESSQISGRRD